MRRPESRAGAIPRPPNHRPRALLLALWLLLAGLGAATAVVAAGSPRAVTLTGKAVTAPGELAPRSLLVISFRRTANAAAREWRSALDGDARTRGSSVYSVVVLDGAPGFVRRMVVRALRGEVAAPRHDSYLIVEEGAEDWRELAGSNGEAEDRADAVFVVLLEGGEVCARRRGLVSEAALDLLFSAACGP